MRLHTLVFISVTPVVFALASCSDDGDTTSTTTTSTSTGTGGEGGTGGGTGGTGGGMGGAGGGMGGAGGGMGGAGGGMGGAGGGMGGAGGAGGGSMFVNGCDPAMATDMTGMGKVTITAAATMYEPACVRVSTGTAVTWQMNFTVHPLVGGEVVGVTETPDPNSPIKPTSSGMMATFNFPNAGTYGFYCDTHSALGMIGAVIVE